MTFLTSFLAAALRQIFAALTIAIRLQKQYLFDVSSRSLSLLADNVFIALLKVTSVGSNRRES
jgi:hypothetical protein